MKQIELEANRLIKGNYYTKKGKQLKRLNKHSKDYFKDPSKYSFVEDGIKIYKYLTENGLMIPKVGSAKSGGRIIDSIAFMPSWIRKMIKINGKRLFEADYKCLHPNIALALYQGKTEYLTHGIVANELNMNVQDIKLEHLSFFNKTTHEMKKSMLWNFYEVKEPLMLKKVVEEKLNSEKKYKITSRKLFNKEVSIMTDVIKILNAKGIFVGYVFDALICQEVDAEMVEKTMNEVIIAHGVKTKSDITRPTKLAHPVEAKTEIQSNINPSSEYYIPIIPKDNNSLIKRI